MDLKTADRVGRVLEEVVLFMIRVNELEGTIEIEEYHDGPRVEIIITLKGGEHEAKKS